MWGYRFLGISFAILACLGLMDRGQALATYSASPDFSMNRPLAASPAEGSFKVAITAGNMSSPSVSPEKAAVPKPEKIKKKEKKCNTSAKQ